MSYREFLLRDLGAVLKRLSLAAVVTNLAVKLTNTSRKPKCHMIALLKLCYVYGKR